MNKSLFITLAAAASFPIAAGAQIITTIGETYTQNFSTLSTETNVAQPWTNGATIGGWSALSSLGGDFTSYTPQWQTGVSAGVLYHLRNTGETDKSFLGIRVVTATGNGTVGFQINNNTGGTLTSFDLGYLGSQFYKTGVAQQLQVSFSTNATSLTSGDWTTLSGLTYTAPYTTGNASVSSAEEIASRATLSVSGQAVNWADGDDLWVRFTSFRDLSGSYSSGAAVLAITDVSFTAVPEPSTYAALFGALALAGVVLRRRLLR